MAASNLFPHLKLVYLFFYSLSLICCKNVMFIQGFFFNKFYNKNIYF